MNDETIYPRRDFVSKLGVGVIGGLIAALPLKGFCQSQHDEKNFAVDPMTAITIAKTSLDVIAMFSGSKSSAMAAMMQYQILLLQNIIQQLSLVQAKLVEIQNAIAELPEEFRTALSEQFKIEMITEIQAAALRYNNNILAPSLQNPDILNNPQVKNEIENIIYIADQKISGLALMEGGIGPQACMIAPLAMSLNIAGRTSLKYPKEVIVSSLHKYRQWFDAMLSSKSGSISDVLNQAARTHDEYITSMADDRLANRLQLQNFKLEGNQKATEVTDPGIIFHQFGPTQIQNSNIDSHGGTATAQNIGPSSRALYRVKGSLNTFLDSSLGGMLINYKRSSARIYSKDDQFNWEYFQPAKGEYYYINKIDWDRKYPSNTIINMFNNGQTIANREEDVSRQRVRLVIANANLERAKMCFCAQAKLVAINSKKRIQEYLNVL